MIEIKSILLLISLNLIIVFKLPAQEYMGTSFYDYYKTLEIAGIIEKNQLSYHSFTFDTAKIRPIVEHPWKNKVQEFDSSIKEKGAFSWLPFEQYFSFNTRYARGFNDGAIWQGKGLNAYAQGGCNISFRGFSLIFSPLLWYSQNLPFPLVASSHESPYGAFIPNIDLPQRFGNQQLIKIDWGESEVRYSYGNFTVGFGNQSIWLGPTFFNALILSNNGGGFPKIDFGLKKTYTSLGFFEGFFFWGNLADSDFVDSNLKNENRSLVGYSLSFAPALIPGFTIGFHRTAHFYSDSSLFNKVFAVFSEMTTKLGADEVDQRASLTFEWMLPTLGFKVYGEWARNDFNNSMYSFVRELEHSQAYTLGLVHSFYKTKESIISYQFEITETMHTVDYQTEVVLGRGTAGFYTHHIVQHGYTVKGQLLGAAIGPGADSQYFGLNFWGPFGKLSAYAIRRSINKDYLYGQPDDIRYHSIKRKSVEVSFGLAADYIINPRLILKSELVNSFMISWNYIPYNDIWNFQFITGLRIAL